ncbi:MAG: DUF3189 family protein [Clostridia bacterium]|nr:DUF3189 family protein [Clostridia bacterium]
MKLVIYACFSGTHAAVVAALIHLGWLKPQVLPSWEELDKHPEFNTPTGRGGLRFLGRTGEGYAVYTAAIGNDGELVRRAVQSFLPLVGRKPTEVVWLDLSQQVSLLWRAGAFLQRYSALYWLGTLLLRYSLKKDYWRLVKVVGKVRANQ